MSELLLETRQLHKSFGGLHVTRDVNLRLQAGDKVGLIGPNGAGKTTLINLITGVLTPSAGSVRLAGEDVSALSQAQRVKRGLVRTFQITQLAPTLPVRLQVEMAIHERQGSIGRLWRPLGSYSAVQDEAQAILQSLRMDALAARAPVELAYGEQRLVEIALAMALHPRVLLLDEPMAGVPTGERQVVLDALASLPSGLAILMIEHDMDLVFHFADRMMVLAEGAVLAEGSPAEIRRHPAVRAAYLGEEA
jgi:ABC-type branched-subunit amino acid transport system ATPase component